MTAAPESYAYDVFISYSTQDKDWVRGELLQTLEGAGLRVGIDFRDFRPGAATITEIERLAETSERTLLILTPHYVESEWTEFETILFQTFDPANKKLRMIPLRKAECEIPKRLKVFTYVDFAEPDDLELAWTRVLTALGKPPQVEAADQPATPRDWLLAHPYGMPPNFTGRKAELGRLDDWLAGESTPALLVLRALGGFGKSALTWHWLTEQVDAGQWRQVVWWSFYETSASFENFLRVTLGYLTGREPGASKREQLNQLLGLLRERRVLLVLDGFERELRAYSGMGAAYQGDEPTLQEEQNSNPPLPVLGEGPGVRADSGRDCVNPLAEDFLRGVASLPQVRGRVLMSTRLRPKAVEISSREVLQGCREVELTQLQPEDAVAFFWAQGIRGTRAEIAQICGEYGYHPLSLRLLAGFILDDFEYPGDVKAAASLDLTGDLVQRRNHVLARSYENLSESARQLLGQIACFRGPVQIVVLEQVGPFGDDGAGAHGRAPLQRMLRDLVTRGLLHFDGPTRRFDLHPIVRRYAYDRMARPERTAAHAQLRDYFEAVPPPERVETLADLEPVIELYHHQVRAGQYDEAFVLFRDRINKATYYQLGAYQLQIELLRALFPQGEGQRPQLQDEGYQGWTLNALANSYGQSGQPTKAVPLFEKYAEISEQRKEKGNWAIAIGNLAIQQIAIGALQAAEANLRRSIALFQEIENKWNELMAHAELGRLLVFRGDSVEAEKELDIAISQSEDIDNVQYRGICWAYRSLAALLQVRAGDTSVAAPALAAVQRALELTDETARNIYPVERDYVRSHWLLGSAHRINGDLAQSDHHLSEALTRCRTINLVEFEADILLDLARLQAAQGQVDAALRLANETLLITERCGYRLQGADVRLFLGQRLLAQGDRAAALGHARQARELARCDGGEFVYSVAYDEAGALLGELGEGLEE